MKFLELKNDGKNDYYELKTDEELYRGDDRNIDIENYYPRFFVKDIEYTKAYGKIIYKFTVQKKLKLLAVDKNIKEFYEKSLPEIKTILLENYGYESKKRLSESDKDNKLLDSICKSDYDGYATDKMDTEFSHFDPEITICKPQENLSEATIVDTGMSEEDIENAHDDAGLIKNSVKTQRKEKRKKARSSIQTPVSPIKISSNLFDDDDDIENDENSNNNNKMNNNESVFTRLSFGGKRKSKRKSVKKKKKSPKFWRDMKPSKKGRKTYKKKYGSRCFLLPSQLKYPVCDKKTGKMNCKGLLAAHYRASLSIRRKLKPKTYSYRKITKKAKKLAKKNKCNWTKKK